MIARVPPPPPFFSQIQYRKQGRDGKNIKIFFFFKRRRSDAQVEAGVQKIVDKAEKKAAPKKPSFSPPPAPTKIVKNKNKSCPPAIPEPTYAALKKTDISLPLPPPEQQSAERAYASSMADLNTCGLPDVEMLRRTRSMRNPPHIGNPPFLNMCWGHEQETTSTSCSTMTFSSCERPQLLKVLMRLGKRTLECRLPLVLAPVFANPLFVNKKFFFLNYNLFYC